MKNKFAEDCFPLTNEIITLTEVSVENLTSLWEKKHRMYLFVRKNYEKIF